MSGARKGSDIEAEKQALMDRAKAAGRTAQQQLEMERTGAVTTRFPDGSEYIEHADGSITIRGDDSVNLRFEPESDDEPTR